jgi:protein involved in polysaccharide export with SLBB domain
MKKLITLLCSWALLLHPASASEKGTKKALDKKSNTSKSPKFNIRELTLPSEVEDLAKSSGNIFYSKSVKGKVLIPIHFWGEVKLTGLHFMPVDTNLIHGVSMAGGPTSLGILENVKLTTKNGEKRVVKYFDLSTGGDDEAYDYKLQPGDSVFIEKSNYLENRAYYTSLIGVVATILSSILLYRQVEKNGAQ